MRCKRLLCSLLALVLLLSIVPVFPVSAVEGNCDTDGHIMQRVGHRPPTCKEDGYSGGVTCLRCGKVLSEGKSLPAYCSAATFSDVAVGEWYHESIDFAVNSGLMNGISIASFAPKASTSRAMIVSVLYRMEGSPAVSSQSEFSDVKAGQWYTNAIVWASKAALVNGYGKGKFGPNDPVTREQLVTILYRYAGYKGLDVASRASLEPYWDRDRLGSYALEPFSWAVAAKLVNGQPDGRLEPQGNAQRAQFAAVMMRLFNWAKDGLELPYSEIAPQSNPVLINGTPVTAYRASGVLVTKAEDFAKAAGLTVTSQKPLEMANRDDVLSLEKGQLTVNGTTYNCPNAVYAEGAAYLPLLEATYGLAYPIFTDATNNTTYITPAARPFAIPANVNVPVLMYHAVSDDCWGIDELFVSPSDMDKQLAYLVENGYDPIWFEDLAHLEDYDKPVILTFDDGYDDNYDYLFPLLKKYNVKATIFVIGCSIGGNHKATAEQIKEMADSGLVSIQSHTYSHDFLDTLTEEQLVYEMSESQILLTRLSGKIPYVLCYPSGRFNSLAIQVGRRYYNFGIKMGGGQYNTSADRFLVNRYYISRFSSMDTFIAYISRAGT